PFFKVPVSNEQRPHAGGGNHGIEISEKSETRQILLSREMVAVIDEPDDLESIDRMRVENPCQLDAERTAPDQDRVILRKSPSATKCDHSGGDDTPDDHQCRCLASRLKESQYSVTLMEIEDPRRDGRGRSQHPRQNRWQVIQHTQMEARSVAAA